MRTLLTAALICGFGFASAAQANVLEKSALKLINAQRTQAGCKPLKLNAALQSAAAGHAKAMAKKNFFSHKGPGNSTMQSRIDAAGYGWSLIAENIAAGQSTAQEVVETWMKSPGHRANILNCALRETGLALVDQPDDAPLKGNSFPFRYYWVQTFGSP